MVQLWLSFYHGDKYKYGKLSVINQVLRTNEATSYGRNPGQELKPRLATDCIASPLSRSPMIAAFGIEALVDQTHSISYGVVCGVFGSHDTTWLP